MLDPAVLATLADLELVSRVVVDGTVSGAHRSPFHGYSAEFSQYRHYRPGDDLKYVGLEAVRANRSAAHEAVPRDDEPALSDRARYEPVDGVRGRERRQQAALRAHDRGGAGAAVSRQGDAVGLVAYADRHSRLPAEPGRADCTCERCCSRWRALEPDGETRAAAALGRTVDMMRRRGLIVVISDLYDEDEEVEPVLQRAAHAGHEVVVFHLLTRDEIALPFNGDVELADLETGRTVVSNGNAGGRAYREAIAAFLERWRGAVRQYGIDYVRVLTDTPLDEVLRSYLHRRTGRLVT